MKGKRSPRLVLVMAASMWGVGNRLSRREKSEGRILLSAYVFSCVSTQHQAARKLRA